MVKRVNMAISTILLGAIALVVPSSVSADDIALTFDRHNLEISGDFVDFRSGTYVLITANGELQVPAEMVRCSGDHCVDAAVQLNAYDGSTSMTGSLVAYHNGSYQLGTQLGVVFVSARYVACDGAACPPLADVMLDVQDARSANGGGMYTDFMANLSE